MSSRPALTRQRIVAAAIEMADADGLNRLTMRALATELGFEVMSLYNHVSNKTDLVDAMIEAVAGEMVMPDGPDWRTAIREHAISAKDALMSHHWAPALWASSMPGPARFDVMEWQLATLAGADLTDTEAHDAFHAVANHIVGYAMQAASLPTGDLQEVGNQVLDSLDEDRYPQVRTHIQQHLSGDHGPSFEYVLDLVIDGIAGA